MIEIEFEWFKVGREQFKDRIYANYQDCGPLNSIIHNFTNVSKINDYENVIYFISSS